MMSIIRTYFNWVRLLLSVVVFFLIGLCAPALFAGQYTISWDPNPPPVDGYLLFMRTENQTYDYNNPVWSGIENTVTTNQLSEGVYFLVVRAYLGEAESADSNEVKLVVNGDSNSPDIKANGSDGPVTISSLDALVLTVAFQTGDLSSINCDWWCVAQTPLGWYYYEDGTDEWLEGIKVTKMGPLADIGTLEVLNRVLPNGEYTFYFGVDDNMNGFRDGNQFFDSVDVTVEP